MSQSPAYPILTPEEVIALRRKTTSGSTEPWSDTLAFADALFKALAAKTKAPQEEPVDWDALDALGWQRMQCDVCGDLARAAPYPSRGLQDNALRYVQLRKRVRVEETAAGPAFKFEGLQPAAGAGTCIASDELDAAVDAFRNRTPPSRGQHEGEEAESTAVGEPSGDAVAAREFDRPTIRAVLDLFEVEGNSDGVYYNEPNDYGVVTLRLHTGDGDPAKLYLGEQVMGEFATGQRGLEWRGTGRYKLNDALVDLVWEQLQLRQEES
ncbi:MULTISPECIES: hypothetical protein [unclassified Variovorax]|uniref:hypothetical protein n=1 Tax=unclassified Variovorax TaxID=663243 RepID=UPI000CA0B5E9|nr:MULTISPECIES: hypothetical protein [unclassified Variovorax]ART90490.1 hypothetical protein [uncultured bacterium]VTU43113.1 hypothetical protein H6P1_00361 [Variovorax sp. PBL-H6]VTU43439.1 hypothetical protein SRS16P1_00544 [Variovorax sp. SRS16]VTU43503.1 hypothetical protein E5P1_00540 [Variovorax sp. PBL-E5]